MLYVILTSGVRLDVVLGLIFVLEHLGRRSVELWRTIRIGSWLMMVLMMGLVVVRRGLVMIEGVRVRMRVVFVLLGGQIGSGGRRRSARSRPRSVALNEAGGRSTRAGASAHASASATSTSTRLTARRITT